MMGTARTLRVLLGQGLGFLQDAGRLLEDTAFLVQFALKLEKRRLDPPGGGPGLGRPPLDSLG